jgi:hypothetical protein
LGRINHWRFIVPAQGNAHPVAIAARFACPVSRHSLITKATRGYSTFVLHTGFVGFQASRLTADDSREAVVAHRLRIAAMHDFIIALAFIGMVIAPAVVAASSSREAMDDTK